jgi:hypothetical protein
MRTLTNMALGLGLAAGVSGLSLAGAGPANAQGFSIDAPGIHVHAGKRHHHRYYGHYRRYHPGYGAYAVERQNNELEAARLGGLFSIRRLQQLLQHIKSAAPVFVDA